MTTKEKIFTALAGLVGLILFILMRDGSESAAIAAYLRRKSVEGLADKINDQIKALKSSIGFTEARLTEEAIKYRQLQKDESPEAIKAYYKDFFNRNGYNLPSKGHYNA